MPADCIQEMPVKLSVQQALDKIETAITAVSDTEKCNLQNALERIIAEPVLSKINIPSDRNASMDGYAVCSADLTHQPVLLELIGTSWAGKPFLYKILPGQCVRIFTGAVVPAGADSVIMQERVKIDDEKILFPEHCVAFENIREPGEDIKQGENLINAPKRLHAADIGLLATAGIYDVSVFRKLKIAFFSTGDELISIGQQPRPGQIYDSNRYLLYGLLKDVAYECADQGVLIDDKQLIKTKLLELSKHYDVIISTGGASVGDADYIKEIIDEIGTVNFWKIAMKPGKPLAFGRIKQSYFFGLPGNPVSVIATFQQIVTPALKKLSGEKFATPLTIKAMLTRTLKKIPGRLEFQRGILSRAADGELQVESAGKQASNILSAASHANCYIVLPTECAGIAAGQEVSVQPFNNYL